MAVRISPLLFWTNIYCEEMKWPGKGRRWKDCPGMFMGHTMWWLLLLLLIHKVLNDQNTILDQEP